MGQLARLNETHRDNTEVSLIFFFHSGITVITGYILLPPRGLSFYTLVSTTPDTNVYNDYSLGKDVVITYYFTINSLWPSLSFTSYRLWLY